MSIFETGYLKDYESHFFKKNQLGTISLIDKVLIFNGKKNRLIKIPLSEISGLEKEKKGIRINLKNGKFWLFALSNPQAYNMNGGILNNLNNLNSIKQFKAKQEGFFELLKNVVQNSEN